MENPTEVSQSLWDISCMSVQHQHKYTMILLVKYYVPFAMQNQ